MSQDENESLRKRKEKEGTPDVKGIRLKKRKPHTKIKAVDN